MVPVYKSGNACAMRGGNQPLLKEHPRPCRLRMGIHSGPVSGVVDVNERANLAGAGINIAKRVMDCGDTAHILLSNTVAEDLEQYDKWRPHLHDLGLCEVKHGMQLGVVEQPPTTLETRSFQKGSKALKNVGAKWAGRKSL